MNIEKINLLIPQQKRLLTSFLLEQDLELDNLEICFAGFDEYENIVATGGRTGNILKCFAIKESYRAMGLFEKIISAVLEDGYKEGYHNFFVYTKKTAMKFFQSIQFTILAEAENSVLLFRGKKTPEDILNDLYSKTVYNFSDSKIGAIVMNANPFTNGHRFLIDSALKEVDFLFVFAVQSDSSFFSFDERLMLIKQNTRDLKNVAVLPSTDLLISNATFPSYFLKEEKLINKEHAIIDAKMFLKYFVPYFNIKTRFLGAEPLDESTAIYNETLAKILPPKCEVKIIPRLQENNIFVNATAVRKAFKENSLEGIKGFVSDITYDFLKNKVNE
ncbi:MAG: [citrate (pro-3S)-lyase] ligase [Treponema sp.]|nr:MAG: [citrate (pro-3S)-lyase] ligase [Treponema sp.]